MKDIFLTIAILFYITTIKAQQSFFVDGTNPFSYLFIRCTK